MGWKGSGKCRRCPACNPYLPGAIREGCKNCGAPEPPRGGTSRSWTGLGESRRCPTCAKFERRQGRSKKHTPKVRKLQEVSSARTDRDRGWLAWFRSRS